MYNGDEKTTYRNGRCVITTHRLFWIHEEITSLTLSLSCIKQVDKEYGFLQRSGKLKVEIKNDSEISFIKLSFKTGGRDDFENMLQKSLLARKWKEIGPSTLSDRRLEDKRTFSTAHAGISGIMRQQARDQEKKTILVSQAFTDLDALMEKAKDMVALLEKYAHQQKRKGDEEGDDLSGFLLDLGIVNPVTKQNAGSSFHIELARQLADFLPPVLESHHGILSLTNVYCIFNRARGVALISPDDLIAASKLLNKMNLGIQFRKFPSGLLVIQSDQHGEEQVVQRLKNLLEKKEVLASWESKSFFCTSRRRFFVC